MRGPRKRKISAGTVAILLLTLSVLGGTGFVWSRLSSGKTIDLSRLQPESFDLHIATGRPEEIPDIPQTPAPKPAVTAAPATAVPEEETKGKSFTLTVAGTVALEGEVRKNSYYSDSRQYDYYDIMMLLKKELQSDLNIVFLENLISEDAKSNDVTAAGAGAAMLKAAGFNAAACGFSRAYDKEEDGAATTRRVLSEYDIQPLGTYGADETHLRIMNANGIRTALLQYTETIPSATRRKMEKGGTDRAIPAADPESVAADIALAREQGCGAVIVLLNWGKTGKAPDKNMKALAQQIADAGADLIIGNGSRIVSGAEILTAAETGREVLCVWSLGTTLGGDRSNIRRIAGMLLQATVRVEKGRAEIRDACYIPLYTWKYKQDSRFYYRCLPADRPVPDGMDSEQQKMMKKAAESVRNAMKDSPVEERESE